MILFPIKRGVITQKYADNANPAFYSSIGLKSHGGVDIVSFHGDTILASEDMVIYKIYNLSAGDVTRGFGVHALTIPDSQGNCTEYVYWHSMSNIPVTEGQLVKQGDVVALEGDSGAVFVGGVQVPDEDKGKPPYPGTHVHWGKRLIQRVSSANGTCLRTTKQTLYQDPQGNYYSILDIDNGNNGLVDPMTSDVVYELDLEKKRILETIVGLYKKIIALLLNGRIS